MKEQASKIKVTEKHLIEAAKLNPARFAPLYDLNYKQIFIFVFKKVRDEELTADITSRVFLKALLNLSKYEHRGFPFSSWLYRIASNEVNMHFRKVNKKQEVELNENDLRTLLDEVCSSSSDEQMELVINGLNQLPLEQMDLIDMRFFEKRSFREIGEITGTTEGNAKIKVYRALKKLKKIILPKS